MNIIKIAAITIVIPSVLCYDESYDKIDVEKIVGDDAMFNSYVDCLLDRGPCTLENSGEFRKLLPEVIATACAKCTPVQRQKVRMSVKAVQTKKPEDFKLFVEKYDPKSEYQEEFMKFMTASD